MSNSVNATSIRLPDGADDLLDEITKHLRISRAKFMRDAIMEKLEDALDIQLVEEITAQSDKN